MIDRLNGTLMGSDPEGVVVDVGGVGFRLETSATTARDMPAEGDAVQLFTHLHVREDALQLFGFSTEEERALFLLFIGVSKIGPKLALAALSSRRPADVRRALSAGDVAAFQSVPGIGKKTAERLILELREKVGEMPGGSRPVSGTRPEAPTSSLALARAALTELGLTPSEAEARLWDAQPDEPVDDLVRRALRPVR